jgi:hypothetical protein
LGEFAVLGEDRDLRRSFVQVDPQRFGWRRTFDLDTLQAAANAGGVAIIVARRADANRSGHITVVVPETASRRAERSGGDLTVPLQSQAGAKNFRYGTAGPWWLATKFSKYGLWVHD